MSSNEEVTNYYAILGAAEDASQEEIERLYKRLIAVLISLLGVWKVHQVIISARNDLPPSHVLHHYVLAQELAFWSISALGAYGLFILLTAM